VGFLAALGWGAVTAAAAGTILSPEEYFHHAMGADRKLVSYDEAVPYLEYLAGASDRVMLDRIGASTLGRDLVMLRISTPENLANSDKYKEISSKLNDPRELTRDQIAALADSGKTVLLMTMNIHADEILPSQMSLEWAWRLATGSDDTAARYLKDVIVLLVPSLNPDGQVMVTDWYRRYVGSEYEGCDLPWLYHHYAGHDNNRDWFMLNLKETRAVNHVAYHEWFPQVLVDEHQMGMTGPRIFVPPYADPVSDRVHPLIYRGANLFGSAMAMRLEQEHKSGVIYGYLFDAYWPGGTRSTPWWKNTVGILVETASCRVASPIYIDPGELTGGQKGLADYQPQINFPKPWPGGWWHPRDVVDYGLIASDAALETASRYRADLLRNRAEMALDVIASAGRDVPYAYAIPVEQHDPGAAARMVDLLRENGLEAFRTTADWEQEGHLFAAGTVVFPTRQPMAGFLVEMMEPSDFRFVRVRPNSGEYFRPYDVTAWTLPLLAGVSVNAINDPVEASLVPLTEPAWDGYPGAHPEDGLTGPRVNAGLSPDDTESYIAVLRLLKRGETVRQARSAFTYLGDTWPAGTFLVSCSADVLNEAVSGLRVAPLPVDPAEAEPVEPALGGPAPAWRVRELKQPRVGLYQSWLPSMDEGWTRCVFDEFEVPYRTLHNDDIRRGNLSRSFDAVIMPDIDRDAILTGEGGAGGDHAVPRPDPYSGGLDPDGVRALVDFVREGGMLITLGESSELALKDFNLPVTNETGGGRIGTPGTLLRVEVDPSNPLAYGMPVRAAIYHTSCPVFSTNLPAPGQNRTVIARYPATGDIVLSGWGTGTELLRRKAALVEAEFGEGRVVLFGFRPQYRAQTLGTYRMLFNAVLDAAAR